MIFEPKVSHEITIHFIRHAETDENVCHPPRFGSANARITARGREQAEKLGEYLREHQITPDIIYASHYERAHETAAIIAKSIGYQEQGIIRDERLREISRGDWTGKLHSDVLDDCQRRSFREDAFDHRPPNGESMHDVSLRMDECFQMIAQTLNNRASIEFSKQMAIVVSHGRAIQALHARFSQCRPELGWRYVLDNTSITTFVHHMNDGWKIARLNARPHLGW
mgnify:CR=1 FL=1